MDFEMFSAPEIDEQLIALRLLRGRCGSDARILVRWLAWNVVIWGVKPR
jgi:hypothetical protein